MAIDVRDQALLQDMKAAATNIQTFITGCTLEEYHKNILIQSAVERQLEIIGEAARKVSGKIQEGHPEIPWRGIIGQRNVLAHGYGSIDDEKIWVIASIRIPELINQLKTLLNES